MKERKYVTISEAAEICAVCTRTVHYWISEGYLKVVRTPSGAARIDKTLLLRPDNGRRVKPEENVGLQRKNHAT
jgi:predicted site-specific integrase-resolvase